MVRNSGWVCGVVAGALLIGGCARIVDQAVYAPDHAMRLSPGAVGLAYEDVMFPAADAVELHGWWVPGTRPGPTVLLLHDARGNISRRVDLLRHLHDRLGTHVFAFDYRGFGRSSGTPGDAGLVADVRGARSWLERRGLPAQRQLLYGRGLGAALAIRSAAEVEPLALVVESSFTTLEDAARSRFPLLAPLFSPWLSGRFDNLAAIRRVRAPTLFIHGGRDDVYPIGMGWRLFDACTAPKRFRTVADAGHDDPPFVGGDAYWQAWETLVAGSGRGGGGE